jgi:hypothetical protein
VIEVERKFMSDFIYFCIKGTDLLHREDGPAVEWKNGMKEWWINGKRHRDDGPAVTSSNGAIFRYFNGSHFSTKESWFEALTE